MVGRQQYSVPYLKKNKNCVPTVCKLSAWGCGMMERWMRPIPTFKGI